MNQVRVAERDFEFAYGVARVARLDDLAGAHALVRAHPVARGRNPRRVPDDLARLALADVYGIVLHPYADRVRLHLLAVLPERQTERRHVQSQLDVGLARLELRALDVPARQSVFALRLEAFVAYEVPRLLLSQSSAARARCARGEERRDESRRFKNPTYGHECFLPP